MKRFQYYRPETLDDALQIMAQFGADARPLIGGTDLMVRIQKGHIDPLAVVDLKRVGNIADTITVDERGERVLVGARSIMAELIEDPAVRQYLPALVDAASTVGSVQIRNRATLVGNICNASPAADTVPVLMVYDASVTVAGSSGTRVVALREFFLGPGKTVCRSSEIVVSVEIPIPRAPFGGAFGRLTRRRGVDLATINMACGIDAEGNTTFVFGAAGPTPILATDVSGRLADPGLPAAERDERLKSLIGETSPISDVRAGKSYRAAMLLNIGRRVLRQALERYQTQAG